MLASTLSQLALSPPPSFSVSRAYQPSATTNDFDPILKETLSLVASRDVAAFKTYLKSLPFAFNDSMSCIAGTTFQSKADVRFYYDTNLIQACWPVALAMVPVERQFDLRLQCEQVLHEQTHPDMCISVVRQSRIPSGDMSISVLRQPRPHDSDVCLCLEFKAPGACQFVTSADLSENDDWEMVGRQIRKYAGLNHVRHILIQDDKFLIYIHFEDPDSIDATVTYAFAAAGAAGSQYPMSQRELFLYAFAQGLKHKTGTLR